MNYYEHHLGDYARDTGHLSILEHGAYRILLDRYYVTEEGIPADQAHRIARARTKEEKEAVDIVLNEFFILEGGIWINRRAEEEIENARKKIAASRVNGKKGGRPKKETQTKANDNPKETQEKPTGFSPGFEIETQTKAHQTPDTISTNISASELAVSAETIPESKIPEKPPERNVQIAVLLRSLGVKPMTALNPDCLEWAGNPSVTDEILRAAIDTARQYKGESESLSPAYLKPIVAQLLNPQPKRESLGNWKASHEGIDAMGKRMGLLPRRGEEYPQYAQRIEQEIHRKKQGEAA